MPGLSFNPPLPARAGSSEIVESVFQPHNQSSLRRRKWRAHSGHGGFLFGKALSRAAPTSENFVLAMLSFDASSIRA